MATTAMGRTEQGAGFDPTTHIIPIQIKLKNGGYREAEYLPVIWRVRWLRHVSPDASLQTELVADTPYTNPSGNTGTKAVFRAWVNHPDGTPWSTAHAVATDMESSQYIQLAETRAIGRALANAGFGIQFAESEYVDPHIETAMDEMMVQQDPPETNGPRQLPATTGNGNGRVPASAVNPKHHKPASKQDVAKLRAAVRAIGGGDIGILRLARVRLNLDVEQVEQLPQSAVANLLRAVNQEQLEHEEMAALTEAA